MSGYSNSAHPEPVEGRRGVEQWQLVGLITRRSLVRIQPPLPKTVRKTGPRNSPGALLFGFC